ncbi:MULTISPECIES: hypothetical protein [Lysinibacillus]|uniref:hypothetical protein n=1 Tax=Lysinibacillus TaxID=400634 RepID=UPI0008890BF1|nr:MULTISPECIES: hypothetical protein [Lysinibacillus]WCH48129.1 hypothetical protein NV349_01725 [Lysinibacillus sp. OF-1]SCY54717.1 hypothetical protein SAMN02787078_01780 [Lysinibacillus sp. SG9]SDB23554.1 hypothetical protein SAMN02787079_01781 [Lysinibacillus sp. TC-37]SFS70072.1 hypothetical protein SAMN02787087_01567 [Lysinibacillus sp. SG55]
MTHFEYMEQQGQLSIFDLEDQYEEMKFKKASTIVSKPIDKKTVVVPCKVGHIVCR